MKKIKYGLIMLFSLFAITAISKNVDAEDIGTPVSQFPANQLLIKDKDGGLALPLEYQNKFFEPKDRKSDTFKYNGGSTDNAAPGFISVFKSKYFNIGDVLSYTSVTGHEIKITTKTPVPDFVIYDEKNPSLANAVVSICSVFSNSNDLLYPKSLLNITSSTPKKGYITIRDLDYSESVSISKKALKYIAVSQNSKITFVDEGDKITFHGKQGSAGINNDNIDYWVTFVVDSNNFDLDIKSSGGTLVELGSEEIKQTGTVNVKYVDEDGNELATSDILSGSVDDPYSTKAKSIPGWMLKETPANASGKFTDTEQTVTYVYTRAPGAAVTVNYVDEAGNKLAPSEVLNGKVDDPYTTKAKDITNWELKTTPANANGKFTSTPQSVTYVYTKKAGAAVNVNYVDEEGNKLATSDVLNGKIDDPYTTKAKDITNWELKTTPANANGKFTSEEQTVTYVYTKKAGAAVNVNYVDEAGNKLATSDVLNGKIDDPYSTKAKDISGWVLKTTPANANGKFTTTAQTVTYVYTRAAGGAVTVNYVDEEGNKLATSDTLNGKIDESYSTKPKNITDWELITTPANANGKFTSEEQTVTYIYTKKAGAEILVRYVDEEGNELAPSNTLNGKLDEAYNTIPKDITDWTLITTPDNASGVFTHSPQTVTYVYSKNDGATVTVKYVDEEGNELATSDTLNGKIHAPYTTNAKKIDGWNLKEVFTTTEVVEKATFATTTDSKGSSAKKETHAAGVDSTTGAFTYEPQTVTYVYKKIAVAKPVVTKPTTKKVDPKKLPKTGESDNTVIGTVIGGMVLATTAVYVSSKKYKNI
ncbi:MucBP domain-containing protein [Lactobacillus sp. YT155]|uniref:MucBP domain-containing protein n=1 Tax=Lactobacillus sp. YT155 TaxID=3060955 RepID=UPI00265EEC94|nr:MucBP domain-containing protein [Lactobacillus sp. YT155]MDO1604981.1 MucBP domain-containing protein [Lactobacillus sp. YT155]